MRSSGRIAREFAELVLSRVGVDRRCLAEAAIAEVERLTARVRRDRTRAVLLSALVRNDSRRGMECRVARSRGGVCRTPGSPHDVLAPEAPPEGGVCAPGIRLTATRFFGTQHSHRAERSPPARPSAWADWSPAMRRRPTTSGGLAMIRRRSGHCDWRVPQRSRRRLNSVWDFLLAPWPSTIDCEDSTSHSLPVPSLFRANPSKRLVEYIYLLGPPAGLPDIARRDCRCS